MDHYNLHYSSYSVTFQVSLDEGTSPNVKVVQVNATDADAGVNAAITYSLSLAPSNDFYIDSRTGNFYYMIIFLTFTEKEIRCAFDDNSGIILLISS